MLPKWLATVKPIVVLLLREHVMVTIVWVGRHQSCTYYPAEIVANATKSERPKPRLMDKDIKGWWSQERMCGCCRYPRICGLPGEDDVQERYPPGSTAG